MRCTLFLASWLLFASVLRANSATDLLQTVSEKYELLTIYEFEGTLSTSLPGTDCTVEFPIAVAAALPAFPPGIHFGGGGRKLSKVCLDAVTKLGSIRPPGAWSQFNSINIGLKDVNQLPPQSLRFAGQKIPCLVLEVLYDDYYQELRSYDGPIRYWIDSESLLIRRVQFKEKTAQGYRLWTATLEKVTMTGPAASWLTHTSPPWGPSPLIGKPAPDFELRTVDGKLVHLAELRGKVVALDFWATWCGACDEEIPILEGLQTEKDMSEVALFGVTEESASDVRKWLSQYKRPFRTLVDAKNTFADYGIKPIPILLIINRHGVVVDCDLGFQSEQLVRERIKKHLTD
jgi:thiol-disulfide isomerase/thioredoxin